jgi:hypothetical protein
MSESTLIRVSNNDRTRINDRAAEYCMSKGNKIKPGDLNTREIVTYLLDKLEKLEKQV